MKKIFVAGSGGMLGEGIYKNFKDEFILKCTDIDVNESWLTYLDFRNFETYREEVKKFEPDFLFHIGAFTSLEFCERNPDETYITNTLSVEHATTIANELDIPVIYISTAGIFDGAKEIYDDWDVPNPIGVYGRSKYLGEVFIKENAQRYFVCRAGWMMGGGPGKDKKFIQKIMSQLKSGKKDLHVVDDKDGTPTYTHDFALNLKALIKTEFYGVYNMVCNGLTSRLDVARELLRILKLEKDVKLHSVSSDYFKEEYFALRPPSERLINKKLSLRNLNYMREWQVSLADYLQQYYNHYLD